MNRLAVFDCDGTLVDSGATIHRALGDCFTRSGIAVPDAAQARRVIGLSLVEAMAALLPDEERARHVELAEDYKRGFVALRQAGEVREPLYEGIVDLIDALEDDNWLLAVATGKSDRGLAHVLDLHGLTDRFVSLQTADRHPSKPNPSMVVQAMADAGAAPATTVVIGDTSFDMMMAVNAGARGIGAGWGYHEPSDLADAGAAIIADRPIDLIEMLKDARHD